MGLPSANRLRRASDFARVRSQGGSWANRLLVLGVAANGLGCSRVGIIVSRRVGGAVVRNRIRRIIRELIRGRLVHIQGGWDLVWVARLPIAEAGFTQIDQAVEQLLKRARLV